MKVAVYGAGATGGYLGLHLARSGVDTTLIARGPHLAAMQRKGVTVIAQDGVCNPQDGAHDVRDGAHAKDGVHDALDALHARPFCTGDPGEAGPQDYVIVALKAHSAPKVVDAMQPLLGPDTAVVTAQNGVPWWYFHKAGGRLEGHVLESVDPGGRQWKGIGPERAIGCVVYAATEIVEPGVIRHIYGNRFTLGEPSGEKTPRVKALSRALAAAGLRAPVRSIRDEIWVKLWGNVSFNPISALTLATLDRIATETGTRAVARAMMTEAKQIGEVLGIRFRIDLEKRIEGTAAVGAHRTSMLQDLESGRAMEIDAVVAAVQEMGRLVGVETPTIDVVLALVRQRAEVAGLYEAAAPRRASEGEGVSAPARSS